MVTVSAVGYLGAQGGAALALAVFFCRVLRQWRSKQSERPCCELVPDLRSRHRRRFCSRHGSSGLHRRSDSRWHLVRSQYGSHPVVYDWRCSRACCRRGCLGADEPAPHGTGKPQDQRCYRALRDCLGRYSDEPNADELRGINRKVTRSPAMAIARRCRLVNQPVAGGPSPAGQRGGGVPDTPISSQTWPSAVYPALGLFFAPNPKGADR